MLSPSPALSGVDSRIEGAGDVRVDGLTGDVLAPAGEKGEDVAADAGGRRVERNRSRDRRRK